MKYIAAILLTLALVVTAHAQTKLMILQAEEKQEAVKEGETAKSYYELTTKDETLKLSRDTANISPPLATDGTKVIFDAIVSNEDAAKIEASDQFLAHSYTDLAGRVMAGEVANTALKKLLRVQWSVTPKITAKGEEPDDGRRSGTIEEFEADKSPGKTWGKASIPHKWLGREFEHLE
jgi:hypothetical protein